MVRGAGATVNGGSPDGERGGRGAEGARSPSGGARAGGAKGREEARSWIRAAGGGGEARRAKKVRLQGSRGLGRSGTDEGSTVGLGIVERRAGERAKDGAAEARGAPESGAAGRPLSDKRLGGRGSDLLTGFGVGTSSTPQRVYPRSRLFSPAEASRAGAPPAPGSRPSGNLPPRSSRRPSGAFPRGARSRAPASRLRQVQVG